MTQVPNIRVQARVDSWNNRLKVGELVDLNFDNLVHYSHDDQLEDGLERMFLYVSKRDVESGTNFAELVRDSTSSYDIVDQENRKKKFCS